MSVDRGRRGFTLIELMIAVAVISLLAAVAYPAYQNSVLKSRRAEAKAALTEAAQRLERYHTENNTYAGARFCATGSAGCTVATQVATDRSENQHYDLTLASATANAFRAVAAPRGGQQADACGTLELTHTGERSAGIDPAKCW